MFINNSLIIKIFIIINKTKAILFKVNMINTNLLLVLSILVFNLLYQLLNLIGIYLLNIVLIKVKLKFNIYLLNIIIKVLINKNNINISNDNEYINKSCNGLVILSDSE